MDADPLKTYVVTTYYVSAPGKRPITHAYGPHRYGEAIRVRRQMLADTPVKPGAILHIAVCRMLGA